MIAAFTLSSEVADAPTRQRRHRHLVYPRWITATRVLFNLNPIHWTLCATPYLCSWRRSRNPEPAVPHEMGCTDSSSDAPTNMQFLP